MVGRGRVLEIVNYWQILSVKPAPTQSAKCTSGFIVGRGRVLEICQLLAHIVGETRPYPIRKMYVGIYGWARRVLEIVNYWHILSVKPAPTQSLLQNSQRASNTIDCFHRANFIECLLKITFPNIVSHDDNFC